MKEDYDKLAKIGKSLLTYITVGAPGFLALTFATRLIGSISERLDFLPKDARLVFEFVGIYAGLAIISMFTGHIIASGWNKIVGCIVASAEYIYSGIMIWDQWGHHRLLVMACMLLVYAVGGFLFIKYQKESKPGRVFFEKKVLVIFAILLVCCLLFPSFVFGLLFPMLGFIMPEGLVL